MTDVRYPPGFGGSRFAGFGKGQDFYTEVKVKFFFDFTTIPLSSIPNFLSYMDRAVYFTSFSGSPDECYKETVLIRELGFEPYVVHEDKQLARQREAALATTNIIEKAKGVDIALTVRMIEDAYRDNYQTCHLYTSDADYLPVIEAVRRMGKQVYVFGYKDSLGKNPRLLHVPDRFVDLGEVMQRYERLPPLTAR